MTTVVLGRESGVLLGFMEEPEPGAHPDQARALASGRKLDAILAQYQRDAGRVRNNQSLSQTGKNEAAAKLAASAIRQVDGERDLLKVLRMHAGEIEYKLIPRTDPNDVATLLRHQEIRNEFRKVPPDRRYQPIESAVKRKDAEFLRALLDAPAGFDLVPETLREEVGNWVLQLHDPDGFVRWETLVEALDVLEDALNTAEVYLRTDTTLSDAERQERSRDEATRRRLIVASIRG